MGGLEGSGGGVCINDALGDDELRAIFRKLDSKAARDCFGLVCKRWLRLESSEKKRVRARAGTHMLRKLAARFTCLLELDLSQSASRSYYPGFTDTDLSIIADAFKSLRLLDLSSCPGITDKGLVAIARGLPLLNSLNVSHCKKLTSKGLSAVAEGCQDLRVFNFGGCKSATDEVLLSLSRNCHNLEDLNLSNCSRLTDSGLSALADGCQRIKALTLDNCNKVGDVGISDVSRACSSSLQTVRLLDCCKVGGEAIFSLAKYCSNLETLLVGGCRLISDEPIIQLAAACSNSLKVLRMDWCSSISDHAVNYILSRCTKLEHLDMGFCEKLTDAAFRSLDDRGSMLVLKRLNVSHCSKITVAGIQMLLESCHALEDLNVDSCPNVTLASCIEAGLRFPKSCSVSFEGNRARSVNFFMAGLLQTI